MSLTVRLLGRVAMTAIVGVGVAGAQETSPPTATLQPSSEPAAATSVPVDNRLQPAIDQLERALAELEALEQQWLEWDSAEDTEATTRLEEVAVLEAELAAAGRRSPEADALYDDVNLLVRWSIDEVRAAIERAERPSELPEWAQQGSGTRARVQAFGGSGEGLPSSEGTERLEELQEQVGEAVSRLRNLELERRLDDVQRDIEMAGRIYNLRLKTLSTLSFGRRAEVYGGWDAEAREAVRLELDALELWMRLQWFSLRGLQARISLGLRSFLPALLAGRMLVRILLVALFWRWVQRGRPRLIRQLHRKAREIEDPQMGRRARHMVDFFEAVFPWGFFLLTVLAVGWTLGPEGAELPFFYPLLMIAAAYGMYRLAVDLIVGAAVAGMEGSGIEPTEEKRQKLFRLVRWVVRSATIVGYPLWIYSYRLGKGVLYTKMRGVALLIVCLVLLAVVTSFRREVCEIFLSLRASGRFAELVRSTADEWTGFLVTPIAFLWLCGHGLVGLLRGIAFSFERTRSATAYISRRRMTKAAQQRGYAEGDLDTLPTGLVQALDEELTIEDIEAVGEFPGLEVARASAAAWREGEAGGSLLLAGEEGLGQTAWLERFFALEGAGTRLKLNDRLLSPTKVRGWLGEHLLPDSEGSMSHDELIEAICAGPSRVVTLEGAENLFLATVNGYRALTELGPIIDGTRRQVFWLLTMRGLAWNHLRAAGKELAFLRRKFVLEPMTEQQIEALIEYRLRSGGFTVSYADLMAVEGSREDEASRNKLGKQTFMNLLWDFSGGNPQIALHFFVRSLEVAADDSLRVLPFQAPLEDELANAGDEALFLLAAVMRHDSLNIRQAATTTAYPVGRVEGLFLHLLDLGTVAETDDVYRVTAAWRSTVLRVLRRRNILVS